MKEMCYNTNQRIPRCKEVQKFIWPANSTLHPNFLYKNGKVLFYFLLYKKQPNLSISVMFCFLLAYIRVKIACNYSNTLYFCGLFVIGWKFKG